MIPLLTPFANNPDNPVNTYPPFTVSVVKNTVKIKNSKPTYFDSFWIRYFWFNEKLSSFFVQPIFRNSVFICVNIFENRLNIMMLSDQFDCSFGTNTSNTIAIVTTQQNT